MQPLHHLTIVAGILSSACTATLTQALARLPTAQPESPITVQDTVIAAALQDALTTGYLRGPRVIIANGPGEVYSSSLPRVDSVSFLLLSPEHIQELADEYGDLDYVGVSQPTVGDSDATVLIGIYGAFGRARHPNGVIDGPSSCEWRLARSGGVWRPQGSRICAVS